MHLACWIPCSTLFAALWMEEILHHFDDMSISQSCCFGPPSPPELNVVNLFPSKLRLDHLTEILHHLTPDPTLNLGGAGGSRDGEKGPLVRRRVFACLLGGAGFLPSTEADFLFIFSVISMFVQVLVPIGRPHRCHAKGRQHQTQCDSHGRAPGKDETCDTERHVHQAVA